MEFQVDFKRTLALGDAAGCILPDDTGLCAAEDWTTDRTIMPLLGRQAGVTHENARSARGLQVKRVFDILISGALTIFLLPSLVLVACAIKIDSRGPVFFRQMRIGYDGKPFHVLKFRTMFHHMTDALAVRQTERGDARITRVGALLRRLSVDELPQLMNVLRGDMSLVGPRPHAPHTSIDGGTIATVVDGYALRHCVKPGITGLAQVSGARGCLQTREQLERRLAFDLEYISRRSLWLDIKILAWTLRREIVSAHAY